MLDQFFRQSEMVVRFGINETLYGIEAIRAFRKARETGALNRRLFNTTNTTYGQNFATTTVFMRDDQITDRQSQTWVRFSQGWRKVSAHVSRAPFGH
jgi:hypothetical protein